MIQDQTTIFGKIDTNNSPPKKDDYEYIEKIFDILPQIGIFKPYELLDIVSTKDYDIIKKYFKNNAKNILLFNYDPLNNVYHFKLNRKENFLVNINDSFYVEKHISTGSYHQIFKITSLINNDNYALRKQKETQTNDFFDSISDFFIAKSKRQLSP